MGVRIPGTEVGARLDRILAAVSGAGAEPVGAPEFGTEILHAVHTPELVEFLSTLALAGDGGVYVVGGGEVYRQAMDLADVLEITEVDAEPEGDTYFPEIDPAVWRQVARRPGAGFTFVRYERL